MSKFKVGDKVRRNFLVPREMQERTGIQKGGVYTVCGVSYSGASIQLTESKDISFNFATDAFSLESSSAAWDVNEALRLRGLAVQAIQEYNTYLLQQPLLEAIDIPPIK
ncbi:hypothetical protein Skp1_00016 [Klebsiella phage SKP1]|uniref:Uncharacterized protein n=1 Tax=Klebsiella phage SKP1 TaxID=2973662 RepID=A0A9X9P1D2_9CAUD|nr:hypothetical protein Skp1_00016 [Klebsiella phage SKP1]